MITKLPRETEMVGRPVILGLQRTSAARWRSSRTALNVAQTVNSPPTQPQSQQLNSGHHFLSHLFPFLQGLWLEKPEPEPFLHLDRLLTGEVATGAELDLWKHHHDIHQRSDRACQIGVSNNETARKWTPVISYTGNVFCNDQAFNFDNEYFPLKGFPQYDAYEKDIAVVSLYFGDSTAYFIFVTTITTAGCVKIFSQV